MSPTEPTLPPIRLRLLGTVPYLQALALMRDWTAARHAARLGADGNHPPASAMTGTAGAPGTPAAGPAGSTAPSTTSSTTHATQAPRAGAGTDSLFVASACQTSTQPAPASAAPGSGPLTPVASSFDTPATICRAWPTLAEATPAGDEIWLMQHPPVFTLGMNARPEHLLAPGDIPVVPTERGGQVTYHGPGQLMAYLMLALRPRKLGIRRLVEAIEDALIDCLRHYGIDALRQDGAPGIYVHPRLPAVAATATATAMMPVRTADVPPAVRTDLPTGSAPNAPPAATAPETAAMSAISATSATSATSAAPTPTAAGRTGDDVSSLGTALPTASRPVRPAHRPAADVAKIASIGIKTSNGFSYHGLALNAQMDLSPFARINPCGFRNLQMTDIHHEQAGEGDIDLDELAVRLGRALRARLER